MSKKDFWDGYVPEPVKPYRQLQDNGSKYFGESWDKAEQPALTKILNNPEGFCPGNFDTPERANAFLMGLCQEAATEIDRLNKAVADEREACAKVCEAFQARDVGMQPAECAGAIRARRNV